jgi:hypothetical protein
MAGSLEMEVEKNNVSIQEAEAELGAAAAAGGGESVAAIAEGGEAGTAEQQASEGLMREDDHAVAYGFGRPDLQKKKPLVGSVDHYERHVFLCYHAAETWPAKIEKGAYEPLPNSMVSALRNRKTDMPKKVGFFHSPRHHHLFFFFFFFFLSVCVLLSPFFFGLYWSAEYRFWPLQKCSNLEHFLPEFKIRFACFPASRSLLSIRGSLHIDP